MIYALESFVVQSTVNLLVAKVTSHWATTVAEAFIKESAFVVIERRPALEGLTLSSTAPPWATSLPPPVANPCVHIMPAAYPSAVWLVAQKITALGVKDKFTS